jgi:hypothetical protein
MISFNTQQIDRKSLVDQLVPMIEGFKLDKNDLALAISLAWHLSNLDAIIFPNNSAIIIFESVNPKSRSTILYHSPAIDGKEFYKIFIAGMSHDLDLKMNKRRIFVREDSSYKWPLREEDPVPNKEQLNFGIALHEIRHRMQYNLRGTLKLFGPDSKVSNNQLLNVVLKLNKEQFRKMPESLRNKGRDNRYIEKRTAITEFDAQVIEDYAYNQDDDDIQNNLLGLGFRVAWLQPLEGKE